MNYCIPANSVLDEIAREGYSWVQWLSNVTWHAYNESIQACNIPLESSWTLALLNHDQTVNFCKFLLRIDSWCSWNFVKCHENMWPNMDQISFSRKSYQVLSSFLNEQIVANFFQIDPWKLYQNPSNISLIWKPTALGIERFLFCKWIMKKKFKLKNLVFVLHFHFDFSFVFHFCFVFVFLKKKCFRPSNVGFRSLN